MADYEYRVEPFMGSMKESESIDRVAQQLQTTINQGNKDDWEFDRIDTIQVNVKPGCLGAFFGTKGSIITYNFVIFRRAK